MIRRTTRRKPLLSLYRLALLAGPLAAMPAVAQAPPPTHATRPVPLPCDPDLAAYVGVTNSFQGAGTHQVRRLQLAADIAAYSPYEPADPASMDRRLMTELTVPDEPGWGLVYCQDDNFEISVHATDARKRLGSIRIYELESGRLLAALPAAPDGASVSGLLHDDTDVRLYRLVLLSRADTLLGTLLARVDGFDKVIQVVVQGGFVPNRPATVRCPDEPNAPDDGTVGPVGDPVAARATTPMLDGSGYAEACAFEPFRNDTSTANQVSRPRAFDRLFRHAVLYDTVTGFPSYHVVMSETTRRALDEVRARANAARSLLEQIAPNQVVPPYSTGCAHMHAEMRGTAAAVLEVPFKRNPAGVWELALIQEARRNPPKDPQLLSAFLAAAYNKALEDPKLRSNLRLLPGDVTAAGDIYFLDTVGVPKQTHDLRGITQEVTFTLTPNIAPPDAVGRGAIIVDGPDTTPAPPPWSFDTLLMFRAPGWSVTRSLPKGYRYRATGTVISAPGYREGTTAQFFVPGSTSVSIPCVLPDQPHVVQRPAAPLVSQTGVGAQLLLLIGRSPALRW